MCVCARQVKGNVKARRANLVRLSAVRAALPAEKRKCVALVAWVTGACVCVETWSARVRVCLPPGDGARAQNGGGVCVHPPSEVPGPAARP